MSMVMHTAVNQQMNLATHAVSVSNQQMLSANTKIHHDTKDALLTAQTVQIADNTHSWQTQNEQNTMPFPIKLGGFIFLVIVMSYIVFDFKKTPPEK